MSEKTSEKRIIARVVQQRWVKDYAVATGRVEEFDATDQILAMGKTVALALCDDDYETDELVPSEILYEICPGEPMCFFVEVEKAIADYFGEEVRE